MNRLDDLTKRKLEKGLEHGPGFAINILKESIDEPVDQVVAELKEWFAFRSCAVLIAWENDKDSDATYFRMSFHRGSQRDYHQYMLGLRGYDEEEA